MSKVWKMDNSGTQKRSLNPSDAVVVGNRSASEGLKSRANGVATSSVTGGVACFSDSAISPPILMSCSSHTEACNELGTTDGVTSH